MYVYLLLFSVCVVVAFYCVYIFLRSKERRFLTAKSDIHSAQSKLKQMLEEENRFRELIQLSD